MVKKERCTMCITMLPTRLCRLTCGGSQRGGLSALASSPFLRTGFLTLTPTRKLRCGLGREPNPLPAPKRPYRIGIGEHPRRAEADALAERGKGSLLSKTALVGG